MVVAVPQADFPFGRQRRVDDPVRKFAHGLVICRFEIDRQNKAQRVFEPDVVATGRTRCSGDELGGQRDERWRLDLETVPSSICGQRHTDRTRLNQVATVALERRRQRSLVEVHRRGVIAVTARQGAMRRRAVRTVLPHANRNCLAIRVDGMRQRPDRSGDDDEIDLSCLRDEQATSVIAIVTSTTG